MFGRKTLKGDQLVPILLTMLNFEMSFHYEKIEKKEKKHNSNVLFSTLI